MSTAVMIRTCAFGDVLMAEPFLWALKKQGYEQIYVLAGYCEAIFENHPFAKIISKLPDDNFDLYDLTQVYEDYWRQVYQGNLPPAVMQDIYTSKFGFQLDESEKIPHLYFTDAERTYSKSLLSDKHKWVAFYMGYQFWCGGFCKEEDRRGYWTFEEWKPVLLFLIEKGYKIAIFGHGPSSEPAINLSEFVGDIIDIRGKLTMRQWLCTQSSCDLFLGTEGSPVIVAQSAGTKGLAIISKGAPASWIMSSYAFKVIHKGKYEKLDTEEVIGLLAPQIKSPPVKPSTAKQQPW